MPLAETAANLPARDKKYEELINKNASPDHREGPMEIEEFKKLWQERMPRDVGAVLEEARFEVFDQRKTGGYLWVVDCPQFHSVERVLTFAGYKVFYAPRGCFATNDRAAWWIK